LCSECRPRFDREDPPFSCAFHVSEISPWCSLSAQNNCLRGTRKPRSGRGSEIHKKKVPSGTTIGTCASPLAPCLPHHWPSCLKNWLKIGEALQKFPKYISDNAKTATIEDKDRAAKPLRYINIVPSKKYK
jgi:hypothetical protein